MNEQNDASEACRDRLFESNKDRLEQLAYRATKKGLSLRDFTVVCIDVDDEPWRPLVDHLMPAEDWQRFRDRGETPVARGTVTKDLDAMLAKAVPSIAEDLKVKVPNGLAKAVVLAAGGATVYLVPPMPEPVEGPLGDAGDLAGLAKALKNGCFVHAFSSGGGLRVVRVETKKSGTLKGYGEHPHVEEALRHADEDYLAGGRPYGKVYGDDGLYPNYLTGSASASSALDLWLRRGNSFDLWLDGQETVLQLRGYGNTAHPDGLNERVLATGTPEEWTSRGYTYRSVRSSFPSGEPCVSIEVIKSPEGKRNGADPWMYQVTKTGRGRDILEATANALAAPETEMSEEERNGTRPKF